MKTTIKLLFLLSVIITLNSCGADDTADIIIYDNSVVNNGGDNTPTSQQINLSGTYVDDLTLDANNSYM